MLLRKVLVSNLDLASASRAEPNSLRLLFLTLIEAELDSPSSTSTSCSALTVYQASAASASSATPLPSASSPKSMSPSSTNSGSKAKFRGSNALPGFKRQLITLRSASHSQVELLSPSVSYAACSNAPLKNATTVGLVVSLIACLLILVRG
jgi:hypothetical protein